jgi:hypothetical protein
MNKIFGISIALLSSFTLCAQKADFSGTWRLSDIKSLSGKLYANAVPKELRIAVSRDSLVFQTEEDNLFPTDIVGRESYAQNGAVTQSSFGKKNRKKAARLQWNKEGNQCIRTSSLYQEDGKNIYVTYTDTISREGDHLIVQRRGENFANGEVWECWSAYEKE